MVNFPVSQVKFDIRLLRWNIIKILCVKPRNRGKANDNDLYLMWVLLSDSGVNWVKFIIDMMIHRKDNPKRALLFSYIVQLILNVSGIVSKEEDMVESQKIMDYYGVSKMRYYRDPDGDYYYLGEPGRHVYDDKVVEPIKNPSDEPNGPSFGSLSANLDLHELVGYILDGNQSREDMIITHIDSVAKESEESRVKLKSVLKDER